MINRPHQNNSIFDNSGKAQEVISLFRIKYNRFVLSTKTSVLA